jgi:signal peptidase I
VWPWVGVTSLLVTATDSSPAPIGETAGVGVAADAASTSTGAKASGRTGADASGRKGAHKRPRTLQAKVIEWVVIVAIAVAVALLVRAFVVQVYYIPSGSMEPTLGIHNRILVDRLSFDFGPVKAGDIVVFATPPADKSDPNVKDLVKRVVGLPGQTISSAPDGQVLIDGTALPESYLPAKYRTGPGAGPGVCTKGLPCSASGTYRIPAGEYFVMGDHRDDSFDSRYFGPISGSLIVGKVVMKVWPLGQITFY